MDLFGEERKQHWFKKRGKKYVMYCGKDFDLKDIERQRRHTAQCLEEVDCQECIDAIEDIFHKARLINIERWNKETAVSLEHTS